MLFTHKINYANNDERTATCKNIHQLTIIEKKKPGTEMYLEYYSVSIIKSQWPECQNDQTTGHRRCIDGSCDGGGQNSGSHSASGRTSGSRTISHAGPLVYIHFRRQANSSVATGVRGGSNGWEWAQGRIPRC